MSNLRDLGSVEGRLCGELAAAIARQVTLSDKAAGPGRLGARFYHDSMSAFEAATEVLTGFGLLAPAPRPDRPGETWFCQHHLTADADDMPGLLAATVGPGDKRLPILLEAFVRVACDFGELSSEREPFEPPASYVAAMRWLARLGYAEQMGDRFAWTDRIGPAMRAAYWWDEDLRSNETLRRAIVETEAETAWRTMPEPIRRRFFLQRPVDILGLITVLSQCWRDGAWHPPAEEEGWISLRGGELEVARRIIEIADGRAHPSRRNTTTFEK